VYLTRTLPVLIEDPNNPDDIEKHQDDRAALALRTLIASRPLPGTVTAAAEPPAYMTFAWVKSLDQQAQTPLGVLARR
jgi:hypothetical protein